MSADLVLLGGPVLTVDPAFPRAEAVAVQAGRIAAVGSVGAIRRLIERHTRVVELAGRAVVPGFVESHAHLMDVAATRHEVDARVPPNRTIPEVLARLRAEASRQPRGTWIRAYGYDDTAIAEGRGLTRTDLDAAVPDSPVYVEHVSGHVGYANSRALALGGVTRDTGDPPGGEIVRAPGTGEPTGALREPPAQGYVTACIPPYDGAALWHGLVEAARLFVAAGVTSVHDMGHPWTADAIGALEQAVAGGQVPLRVVVYARDERRALFAGRLRHPRLRLGGVKLLADGSIQAYTAALREPYHDQPDRRGLQILPPAELRDRVAAAHRAGWQVAVHGNGDAAIDAILDAYEAALASAPRADHRHRIEHCQTVRPDQLERMARLGVHASFFVVHTYHWGDRHRARFLGPDRAERISPLRSARARGVVFGLHSDAPVTPVSPVASLAAAVTRRSAGGHVLGADERITAEDALRALTLDAAALGFQEGQVGSIAPGKAADLVVLSHDPTACPPDRLAELEVTMTILDGSIVHEK